MVRTCPSPAPAPVFKRGGMEKGARETRHRWNKRARCPQRSGRARQTCRGRSSRTRRPRRP
eukprot:2425649-Alexandrium_andersonii.AAC.1